jgi:trimethylamine--corrinoid protein Co-methyltransferase
MLSQGQERIRFQVLTREKIEHLHAATLDVMENVGMRIGGAEARRMLAAAGCPVDGEGIAKIGRDLVAEALAGAPGKLKLYRRTGDCAMILDRQHPVYFGCHADMLEIVDPLTGKVRPFRKADIETMCRVANELPGIDFLLSVGLCRDVRPAVQSQASFIETVRRTSKPVNFSTNDIAGLRDIIAIAADVAGGLERLQARPFIFYYCEPIPPLNHPEESTEKLRLCARHRIPVVYMPYCMMGGTAPMNRAATLVQCNAEVLTGLVLTQLTCRGAPFIYGAMPSIMDMQTTIGSYGAVELHLLIAAAAEMANYYGLPFYGTAGCTDARQLDEQAVAETTLQIFSTLLSFANLAHDVGVSDHCKSINPELVVLCDEIIRALGHYVAGVDVPPEEQALAVIGKVGPGGAYLEEPHTFAHFREVFYPRLFSRKMVNPDRSEVREKIQARIRRILEADDLPPEDPDVRSTLEDWSARLENRTRP